MARWNQHTSALAHQKDYSAARIAKTKGEELRALFDRCKASIEKSYLRYDGPTTELTAWALWTMAERGSESALDLLRAASGGGEALLNTTRLIGAWNLPAEECRRLQIGLGGKGAGYSAIDCKAAGHSAIDCKAAGYSAKDCKAAGYFSSAIDCKAAGYSAKDCKEAGCFSSAIDYKAAGYSAKDCKAAGYSAIDCKAAGYFSSAKDCKAAGYSLEDIVSAGFSGSDIAGAFGLRKLERKDDSERRVGARVLCEGKLGNITELSSDDGWHLIKIDYDDGTKNKAMTLSGWLQFTNRPGWRISPEYVWVGFS